MHFVFTVWEINISCISLALFFPLPRLASFLPVFCFRYSLCQQKIEATSPKTNRKGASLRVSSLETPLFTWALRSEPGHSTEKVSWVGNPLSWATLLNNQGSFWMFFLPFTFQSVLGWFFFNLFVFQSKLPHSFHSVFVSEYKTN